MSTIKAGDTGTFYPFGTATELGTSIKAKVIHVWGDNCVNLETEKGHTPTSVLVWRNGVDAPGAPRGYFFVPDANLAAIDPIEAEILAKGLTAPRVTPADIEANIVSAWYFTAGHGVLGEKIIREGNRAANYPEGDLDPLYLLTFCVLVLRNGFTVTGESACASPENFDAAIGRKIARQNAVQKVWPLMGYALRNELQGRSF